MEALLFFLYFIVLPTVSSNGSSGVLVGEYNRLDYRNFTLGAIVDFSSRAGTQERIAMRIAMEDVCAQEGRCLPLYIKTSQGDPAQAARAARVLIEKHQVRAIVGLGTVLEAAAGMAELGYRSNVPVLSLANEMPSWVSRKWPFLLKAARSQCSQMEAIAAVLQSWQWRKVNIIYDDDIRPTSSKTTLPSLIAALQHVSIEVNELVALHPSPQYYSLSNKLERLQKRDCRVFLVHTSIDLAVSLFKEAKNIGLMERTEESVWITTTDITNHIDTLDPTTISSMQGVIGVRSYFPSGTSRLKHFQARFQSLAQERARNRKWHVEPGISALQAYDAVWAMALAISRTAGRDTSDMIRTGSIEGQPLLNEVLNSSFKGLTGEFKFVNGSLQPAQIFQLVNVIGKAYREIGYWAKGLGFSEGIGEKSSYSSSMSILGPIFWPGGPSGTPRGWVVPKAGKKLKIGVPLGNAHKEFINASWEGPWTNLTVTGFSVDVFKATLSHLPYNLEYEFHAFNGTYDSLVERVYTKEIDGVVADTAIVANRCQYAEFSQPYTDSNLQIVTYARSTTFGRAWLILRPFTTSMWIATVAVNIFCGLTVYVIEMGNHKDLFKGDVFNQTIVMLTLTFTTLFSLQGRKLHSNLSRITTVIWLFVALVITQSYTASLTSFLTVERLTQVDVTVESLVRDGVKVGCDEKSFVVKHLEGLGFSPCNIKTYYEDDYAGALASREIEAAFMESPHARAFLAKNCKGFMTAKETVQVGGFGFVFPKNSPYLPDISEAVLRIAESGTIRNIEKLMLSSYRCESSETENNKQQIGIESFLGLFGFAAAISIVSLVLYVVDHLAPGNYSLDDSDDEKQFARSGRWSRNNSTND